MTPEEMRIANQFIELHGTNDGPLNGRCGGPDNLMLRQCLSKFLGRPVLETENLYRALLAVKELTRWRNVLDAYVPYGLDSYRFDPKPGAQITTIDRFLEAFRLKTHTPDEFMPLVGSVFVSWKDGSKMAAIPIPMPEPLHV